MVTIDELIEMPENESDGWIDTATHEELVETHYQFAREMYGVEKVYELAEFLCDILRDGCQGFKNWTLDELRAETHSLVNEARE